MMPPSSTDKSGPADLVLLGGYIETMTLPAPAQAPTALAVKDGLVCAVGEEEAQACTGPTTRVFDLRGATVLPGINDAHLHFVASAVVRFGTTDVSARSAQTWDGVVRILNTAVPGEDGWIRAHGWDRVQLGPGGTEDIRNCRPDVPVVVFDQTGHQLLANSTALRLAGISSRTPAPEGGVVERNADGEPTGLLQDGAMVLLARVLPPVPRPVLRDALLKMQSVLHAQGITSLTEPGLGPGSAGLLDGSGTTSALELLGEMSSTDELTLRINVLLLFAGTGGVSAEVVRQGLASGLDLSYQRKGIDPRRLRIAGVKVFADGIPRSNTAWMSEAYGDQCTHGSLVVAGDSEAAKVRELNSILSQIHDAGLQAGIHATGDAATETALAALVKAQSGTSNGTGERRHYIIHGAFSSLETLHLMARNRLGYSTNPLIRSAGGDVVRAILGEARFSAHQPLHSAVKAGVQFNIASDSPVATTDWRQTVIAATSRNTIHRPAPKDDPERLTGREALRAMSAAPAWQDHAESYKGTLQTGMAADLCVIDGSWPADADIERLAGQEILLTAVGGRVVHNLIN